MRTTKEFVRPPRESLLIALCRILVNFLGESYGRYRCAHTLSAAVYWVHLDRWALEEVLGGVLEHRRRPRAFQAVDYQI